MKSAIATLLLFGLAVWVPPTIAECPAIQDLDVWHDLTQTEFLCGIKYSGYGDELAVRACRECDDHPAYYIKANGHYEASEGFLYAFGSLIVMPGCTFYGYGEGGFDSAQYRVYEGGSSGLTVTKVNMLDGNIWIPDCVTNSNENRVYGFRAFDCRCTQKPITCVPEDGWNLITSLDNTGTSFDVEFTYTKTVGTKFSQSLSNSQAVNEAVSNAITASFFEHIQLTLGVSAETGYDWSLLTEQEKNPETTMEVKIPIPGGQLAFVEQAVGQCEGSSIRTNMIKITETTKDGAFVREYIHESTDENSSVM